MMHPPYWQDALTYLRRDPTMAALIDTHASNILSSRNDPFHTLARAIVGQQVSVASADAVWDRLEATLDGQVTPHNVLALSDEALRACGFSRQKLGYMRNIAQFVLEEGCTDVSFWDGMNDAAVEAHITQIKGIGRWSAEMFLIFCLMRPDVFPLADIGLQRAMHQQYSVGLRPFDADAALNIAQAWQPYRSVALWFLWRSVDPSEVTY